MEHLLLGIIDTDGVGLLILVLFVVAYYADTKWLLAVGIGLVLIMLNEIDAHLYDICIRLRRTNLILSGDRAE